MASACNLKITRANYAAAEARSLFLLILRGGHAVYPRIVAHEKNSGRVAPSNRIDRIGVCVLLQWRRTKAKGKKAVFGVTAVHGVRCGVEGKLELFLHSAASSPMPCAVGVYPPPHSYHGRCLLSCMYARLVFRILSVGVSKQSPYSAVSCTWSYSSTHRACRHLNWTFSAS